MGSNGNVRCAAIDRVIAIEDDSLVNALLHHVELQYTEDCAQVPGIGRRTWCVWVKKQQDFPSRRAIGGTYKRKSASR